MVSLLAIGQLNHYKTFDASLTLENIHRLNPIEPRSIPFWKENLDNIRFLCKNNPEYRAIYQALHNKMLE